ncbi:hypothetical protein Esti_006422 [Eimeria stiedai]
MKRSTSRAEKARSVSAHEQQSEDHECDNCENGLVDITDVFRRGLATLPPGLIVGSEGFSLEECFHAAELPVPLEDKEIWLGNQSRKNKRGRPSPSHSPINNCDACADAESPACQLGVAEPPSSSCSAGGGLARDGSSLVPYLRLQVAAASGIVPVFAQTAVMKRLLLWLLPLLQGSSPPRTFLRCVFFKKPVPPIVQACREGKWNQVKETTAGESYAFDLALTNNLPLLQCFCAVYLRLCLRLQALNDFGGQELFVYEEDCELSNFSSPWNGIQKTGWQGERSLSAETEREDVQQYTDRVEQTCAMYAISLWGVDDACVEALLQWGPSEGETSQLARSAAAPKTRQERVLRMLLKEAETDREDQGGVRTACRFLCCLALLVEAIIVASELESLESSPYAFDFYLTEGFLQGSNDFKGRSLPKIGQAAISQMALGCLSELLALLRSQDWWLHSPKCCSAYSSSSGASGDAACTPEFDVDLCFTPLFAHFREPIEMTAESLPSVAVFCRTMSHFLQQLHRFISCKWETSEMLEESEAFLPLHEAVPRLLMEELFACFAKDDGDRLRAVTWDLKPPTVPPFPEPDMCAERESSSMQQPFVTTEETSGSALSDEASKGEGRYAAPVERTELPTSLLRVYSYLSLTTVPREIEGAWLSGRFKAWRLQREVPGCSGIAGAPTPLEAALACIFWGCGCKNCEIWGRWKWSLQEFVLSLYSTLHMAPHRQLRHLQRIQTKPQALVEETIGLLGVNRNPWTNCLKGAWGLCPPSSQMKAQAIAIAFDALVLQQQHSLALTILLQLASPAEDVVIYWSLFNVLVSSEEVSEWRGLNFSSLPGNDAFLKHISTPQVELLPPCSFTVASRFRLREGQSVREALWPFYSVRCAPFYLAMQPLWAARSMLKGAPHWMSDENTTAGSDVTGYRAAAGDARLVAKMAKLPANMMQRFSFEAVCDSVEALFSAQRNALASAKLDLQEAVAELAEKGGQLRSSLDQAILDALQETVWRLR